MRSRDRLMKRFPPSAPCSCSVCLGYCQRPGWWTVDEASEAIMAGHAGSMMLEMSPNFSFGVLAPSFRGCEGKFALDIYASEGCTFLKNNRCELFGTGFQPLECRYCHHDRRGLGEGCHHAIGEDWNTAAGKSLVVRWSNQVGLMGTHRRLMGEPPRME